MINVVAVETGEKTFVEKRGRGFTRELKALANGIKNFISDGKSGNCESKIINLAAHEDFGATKGSNVDVAIMSGRAKTNVSENASDVLFPEAGCFRVTLESSKDREDSTTGE